MPPHAPTPLQRDAAFIQATTLEVGCLFESCGCIEAILKIYNTLQFHQHSARDLAADLEVLSGDQQDQLFIVLAGRGGRGGGAECWAGSELCPKFPVKSVNKDGGRARSMRAFKYANWGHRGHCQNMQKILSLHCL